MRTIFIIMLMAFISMQGTSYFLKQERNERWYVVFEGGRPHTSYVGDPETVEMTSEEAVSFLMNKYPYQQISIRYPTNVSGLSGRDKQ